MKQREQIEVSVGGHQIKMEIEPDERAHVERAAQQVNERLKRLGDRVATPQKAATMVAFQFACDLSIANECLDEAEKLAADLQRQKDAVKRLEGLLTKVDSALAY
ncbi:cell division protein ZapA [bacterium]|nr:cell division protein ZapA [bacterium]